MGSLIAALASYCEAKKNNGQWLLRIEDLDPPREVPGASQSFIDVLTKFGFQLNQKTIYQSNNTRQQAYQKALDQLIKDGHTYNCACSRSQLKNIDINEHKCRNLKTIPSKAYSINLKVPDNTISFNDRIQGNYSKNLLNECGDCVLKRKDGLFSYQLAVVVDDSFQNISDIVRGIDLIDSTPWQIYLNSLLNNQQSSYAHIPILINKTGQKLSKQTFAKEINPEKPLETLIHAYNTLLQKPFVKSPKTLNAFWNHAITHWNINKLDNIQSIQV
jgi:glutamyl-Q tRNA(Asp) synthetase